MTDGSRADRNPAIAGESDDRSDIDDASGAVARSFRERLSSLDIVNLMLAVEAEFASRTSPSCCES